MNDVFIGQRVNSIKSTDYFEPKIKKFSPSNSINLGLGLGYRIGEKNKIELNWSQDVSGSTINFLHYTYFESIDIVTGILYKGYTENTGAFSSFILNNRFELKYFQAVVKNFSINFGLGIHYTKELENNSGPSFLKYELEGGALNDKGDSINFTHQIFSSDKRISPYVTLGLDFRVNASNTYLFTLSSNYILGFQDILFTNSRATIYNSTESVNYSYLTTSKGGGIYFEISREMNLSTIISKSKNIYDNIFKRNK